MMAVHCTLLSSSLMQPAFKTRGYTISTNTYTEQNCQITARVDVHAQSNSAPLLSLPRSPHLKDKFQASVDQLPQVKAWLRDLLVDTQFYTAWPAHPLQGLSD